MHPCKPFRSGAPHA